MVGVFFLLRGLEAACVRGSPAGRDGGGIRQAPPRPTAPTAPPSQPPPAAPTPPARAPGARPHRRSPQRPVRSPSRRFLLRSLPDHPSRSHQERTGRRDRRHLKVLRAPGQPPDGRRLLAYRRLAPRSRGAAPSRQSSSSLLLWRSDPPKHSSASRPLKRLRTRSPGARWDGPTELSAPSHGKQKRRRAPSQCARIQPKPREPPRLYGDDRS